MKITISQKLNLLNKTTLDSVLEEDKIEIIKRFTDISVQIFEADFGFAWLSFDHKNQIAYKSPGVTFNPTIPKRKNDSTRTSEHHLFDENVEKGSHETNIEERMKSYIIIPLNFGDRVHGGIVVCYKKPHTFTAEELAISDTISNTAAQAFTIRWLIESQQADMLLVEKQKATEALLSQERLRTEFMANATHELRTPLAIMKGTVYLALSDKGNLKSAQKALQDINVEISALSNILKDLTLLSVSAKNITQVINQSPVSLSDVLGRVIQRVTAIAQEKNIQIKIEETGTKGLLVAGDEEYLTKLFLNLIKNSITYGKNKGTTSINISKDKNMVKIEVSDNGLGISKEDLPKIFDRFFRGDKAHSHSEGNHSGLGLAIAKWVTELHGGTIRAESVLGKGSTFTVSFPALMSS